MLSSPRIAKPRVRATESAAPPVRVRQGRRWRLRVLFLFKESSFSRGSVCSQRFYRWELFFSVMPEPRLWH